ncbi:MAG TPA: hypothetical protein VKB19_11915 [Pedobacter sp.]|nr:hypothetical protein [Pedobacter sp.]
MKRSISLIALLLFGLQASHAQFLNKLKKKAEAAINKNTENQSNENEGSESNASNSDDAPAARRTRTSSAEKSTASKGVKYGSVLFSLGTGEQLCYNEQSLKIVNNQAVIKVITKQNKEYYLYENGEKSGPFKTAPVDQLPGWPFRNPDRQNAEKSTDWQPYLRSGVLTVDGKNQGTYMNLTAFYHNKEKKKFYGIAMNMEKSAVNNYFISHLGKRKLPLIAGELYVSENDESAAVRVNKTPFLGKTLEEQTKYVANDDFYLLFPDGSNKGPFLEVQASKSYLDAQGNFIEISNSRKTIYLNGEEVLKMDSGLNGEGKLFKSADAKSVAWFERGTLFFADGEKVEMAVQPAISVEGGKTILNWITIQNREVYACHREL